MPTSSQRSSPVVNQAPPMVNKELTYTSLQAYLFTCQKSTNTLLNAVIYRSHSTLFFQ